MLVYYNEIDPFAAAWLRELIKSGAIAPGEVDERSIEDVFPADLSPFTQCHFFAGIGAWSYALRNAGWPDNKPVWTGSCPCQPFSSAGKGKGFADERHLWPSFFHLIEQCRPSVVLGEQVASKNGLAWLDLVQADLEGAGYAFGAIDTCAAGFGAPHVRQRLFWVADSGFEGLPTCQPEKLCGAGRREERRTAQQCGCAPYLLASSAADTAWRDTDWILCRDGKWRPVESGTFPLANGAAHRVGRLRGYGNAINVKQAEVFVSTLIDYYDSYH